MPTDVLSVSLSDSTHIIYKTLSSTGCVLQCCHFRGAVDYTADGVTVSGSGWVIGAFGLRKLTLAVHATVYVVV